MTDIYSHLTRTTAPLRKPKPATPPAAPAPARPRRPVDNSTAMTTATRTIEDLQNRMAELERKLQAEIDHRVRLEGELAIMTTERRQAESNYLQAAVERGEAKATQVALESALRNSDAANARLAAMKPPPAPPAKPPVPPPQWKMEVHRDGTGNIREIIATPTLGK